MLFRIALPHGLKPLLLGVAEEAKAKALAYLEALTCAGVVGAGLWPVRRSEYGWGAVGGGGGCPFGPGLGWEPGIPLLHRDALVDRADEEA